MTIPSRSHRPLLDFQPLLSVLSTVRAVLVFLIVQNSGYRPSFETLNTPGIKVVGEIWRG
jgi:hypothetical protein